MILFKHILARILKNNLDLFSRLFFKIILPKSWKIILKVSDHRTGGAEAPEDRPIGLNVFSGKNILGAGGVISANTFNLVKPVFV